MASARIYGDVKHRFIRRPAARSTLQVDEIASALVFLASAATDEIAGAVVPVDGGLPL